MLKQHTHTLGLFSHAQIPQSRVFRAYVAAGGWDENSVESSPGFQSWAGCWSGEISCPRHVTSFHEIVLPWQIGSIYCDVVMVRHTIDLAAGTKALSSQQPAITDQRKHLVKIILDTLDDCCDSDGFPLKDQEAVCWTLSGGTSRVACQFYQLDVKSSSERWTADITQPWPSSVSLI